MKQNIMIEIYRSYFFDLAAKIKQLRLMYDIQTVNTMGKLANLAEKLGMLYTVRVVVADEDENDVLATFKRPQDQISNYHCHYCNTRVGTRAPSYLYLKYDAEYHPAECHLHTLWVVLCQLQQT